MERAAFQPCALGRGVNDTGSIRCFAYGPSRPRALLALLRASCFGLLFVLPATAAQAAAPMASYMSCARALGVAIHERFTILPADRGANGLYLYTDSGAVFLPLGTPDGGDAQGQEFFVRMRLASVGEVFLDFRQPRPDSRVRVQPGISYEIASPSQRPANAYRSLPAIDSTDGRAADVISRKLRERAAQVKLSIDEKNRYSTPADAQAQFERDRVLYLARLEQCRVDGDNELRVIVEEEMDKLRYGLRAPTIWEREVGQRRR